MSKRISVLINRTKLCAPLLLFVFLIFNFNGTAQTNSKKKDALPRVGAIKNYEATGMATGCGNLYFKFPRKGEEAKNYVYLARSEGRGAWMNLNGRDTRLTLLKTKTRHKTENFTQWWHYYRFGKTQIIVYMEYDNASETDFTLKMKITLKKGRSTRTIKAIGYSDC